MNNSNVSAAAASYSNGNYEAALNIYKLLAKSMGQHLFAANIRLCEARLKRLSTNNASLLKADIRSERGTSNEEISIERKRIDIFANSRTALVEAVNVPSRGATLEFSASIAYKQKNRPMSGKALLLFEFLDGAGNRVSTVPGIGVSSAFKRHFRYLNPNNPQVESDLQTIFKLKLPDEVVSFSVEVASLGLKGDDHIEISIQGRCYSEKK